ncbi:hypothetical protein QFC19_000647 [Naganishia cerealis]|uniref:Uncharacterized protein n=1 Tax=Naganishia cerealis TaxID=610337 RepID=A0ACC2WLV8_9TREE|nr:hypothetical protein QFC19_000647 [Naganishia cerealis]
MKEMNDIVPIDKSAPAIPEGAGTEDPDIASREYHQESVPLHTLPDHSIHVAPCSMIADIHAGHQRSLRPPKDLPTALDGHNHPPVTVGEVHDKNGGNDSEGGDIYPQGEREKLQLQEWRVADEGAEGALFLSEHAQEEDQQPLYTFLDGLTKSDDGLVRDSSGVEADRYAGALRTGASSDKVNTTDCVPETAGETGSGEKATTARLSKPETVAELTPRGQEAQPRSRPTTGRKTRAGSAIKKKDDFHPPTRRLPLSQLTTRAEPPRARIRAPSVGTERKTLRQVPRTGVTGRTDAGGANGRRSIARPAGMRIPSSTSATTTTDTSMARPPRNSGTLLHRPTVKPHHTYPSELRPPVPPKARTTPHPATKPNNDRDTTTYRPPPTVKSPVGATPRRAQSSLHAPTASSLAKARGAKSPETTSSLPRAGVRPGAKEVQARGARVAGAGRME